MKKHRISLFFALLLIFLLLGCAQKSEPAATVTTTISETAVTQPTATVPAATATSPAETDTPAPATAAPPTATATPTPEPTATPIPADTATPVPPTATLPPPTLSAEEVAYGGVTPEPGVTLFESCMLDPDCVPPPAPPVERLQNTENILLLGTDRREGWSSWRTDTIMLMVIDHETNQVAVVSFPRDLFVYHPWYGKRKINVFDFLGEEHQYPGGGFQVMKDVFEYNFGIPIHHVVRAHRGAFVEFVDAIGGIDITLDCDLWEISPKDDGGYNVLYLPAGVHHLDGETALEYATFRYRTNDWGRARRQQAVLAAVKDQAAQLGLIAKAPAIWDIVQRNVSTDLGFLDLLRYTKYGLGLDMSSIHSHVFSNRELQSTKLPQSGAYVLFPKEEGVMADVMENIFAYVPISVQGTHPQGCPPPPAWAAEYLAALTPTPAPQ